MDLENNPALGSSKDKSVIINQGDDPVYFNAQLQLLRSRAFLRRVVKTLDLEHDQKFFSHRSSPPSLTLRNIVRALGGPASGTEGGNKTTADRRHCSRFT